MLRLFPGLGTPSLRASIALLGEELLKLFELSLKAEIGTDRGALHSDKGDGFSEGPEFVAHEIGDDESGGLI